MPIYEYDCEKCGRIEVIQKITDEPLSECSQCGSMVKKVVSLSSFALVGGGWYKDLYSSTKANSASSSNESTSSSSTSSSNAAAPPKSESKAAPTAAA